MTAMERVCATPTCKAIIPPQKGRARPRKYCEVCRPPRKRPNPRVFTLPDDRRDVRQSSVGLLEAYRRRLEDAGRVDAPEGVHVLTLAEMLTVGQHTASGAASLSRELRAAMEEAMKGTKPAADFIDELAERRRKKISSA